MEATLLRSSKGSEVVKKYVKAATSQHVVPVNGEWAVKKSNSDRVTKTFDNQREAIAQAIKIAIKQKSEVIIHGKDGKIREKNSYGKDVFPPRG
ncbi:MAG: DUF2188 domain-containing protein [Proteobacteria bacterium]|nr:DUF2188 domain-containing protein [Pseudomonadota bacterium]